MLLTVVAREYINTKIITIVIIFSFVDLVRANFCSLGLIYTSMDRINVFSYKIEKFFFGLFMILSDQIHINK